MKIVKEQAYNPLRDVYLPKSIVEHAHRMVAVHHSG